MATVTNISTQDLRVPFIEETIGQQTVAAGETVELPDELVASRAWPAPTWKVELSAKAGKAKGA